jgi:signal transduction histidine kinase
MTMTERFEYVLEPLREDADFTVYRGRQRGNPSPILAIALCADPPLPQGLRRLEHEYSLAAELDPAWAAKPLALTHHEGRTILVLEDRGGEPLDQVLERDQEQPVDLNRFLRTAIGCPQVLGDRVQLQQVLMNLMVNGIDAMRGVDGTRDLAIRSQRTENKQLLVSVSDTGVGLPLQQADQIFHAFFTTKPHGTGMGLRISRSIVESHGGRLWASANLPRGAAFYFMLSANIQVPQ